MNVGVFLSEIEQKNILKKRSIQGRALWFASKSDIQLDQDHSRNKLMLTPLTVTFDRRHIVASVSSSFIAFILSTAVPVHLSGGRLIGRFVGGPNSISTTLFVS